MSKYDQANLKYQEAIKYFDDYFCIFPWTIINENSEGFDMGCGTGRWARLICNRVKKLNCIEPSMAFNVAKENLKNIKILI